MSRFVVVVTGDRHATVADWEPRVRRILDERDNMSDGVPVLLVGDAPGIDEFAYEAGEAIGYSVVQCLAQWEEFQSRGNRNAAGPARNRAMVDTALLLATVGYTPIVYAFHDDLWNGSRGTRNCVRYALSKGIPVVHVTSDSVNVLPGGDRPQLRLV